MPQPKNSSVHINTPLTNISVAFIQDSKEFIADKIFPMVPVQKQSDAYFLYERDAWFRSDAQERAPGTESSGSGYTIDNTPTYYCKKYAIHKDVSDDIRANADKPIDMDRDATRYVTQQMMLKREKIWMSNYFTTNIWTGSSSGGDITPGTLWDAANSTPIEDIDVQKEAMHKKTGKRANVMVVAPDVHRILRNHVDVLDRIKYTQRGLVTEEILASLFEVDKYVVAYAIENTAAEGQTISMSHLATKDVLLAYSAPRPSIMEPSAGYIFSWTGLLGAGAMGNRIKKFRIEERESDRIEGEMAFDAKLVAPDCGVFFDNVIS